MSDIDKIKLLPKRFPASAKYVPHLIEAAETYKIDDKLILAHWLGNIAIESGEFKTVIESLNYSEKALNDMFGNRITPAQAKRYGRNNDHPADQQAIANIIYGGEWGLKNLGNTQPNDGWHFRGHGLKQTTGRANTNKASLRIFGDQRAVVDPSILARPREAALSAAVYWDDARARRIDAAARRNDYRTVRRLINGGSNGLAEATQYTKDLVKLFA